MPALQGFIVEWPFATPMIGFSKSPSWKPTARNIARLGERATPPVMICERRLSFVTSTSLLIRRPKEPSEIKTLPLEASKSSAQQAANIATGREGLGSFARSDGFESRPPIQKPVPSWQALGFGAIIPRFHL